MECMDCDSRPQLCVPPSPPSLPRQPSRLDRWLLLVISSCTTIRQPPKVQSFFLLLPHSMCSNFRSQAMFTFKAKNPLLWCVQEGEERKGEGGGHMLVQSWRVPPLSLHVRLISTATPALGPFPSDKKHPPNPALDLACNHQLPLPGLRACRNHREGACVLARMGSAPISTACTRSWSISEDSLRRYVSYASESCIQDLLSASVSNKVGGSDGWKVLTLEDGLEISKRRSGSLHVFRSRWLLRSVSPQQFMTVANAIDAAKQWDSHLVEANYIKDLDDNLSILRLRFGDASKPLFKNREFIVYERRETMDDGTLVVAVASLPKEIAAGLQPKRSSSIIRGLLLQSGWVVEKMEEGSCMVTYVVQLDPAGWLPKCFVNRLNTKLVMIIDNLKKMAQSSCPVNDDMGEQDQHWTNEIVARDG